MIDTPEGREPGNGPADASSDELSAIFADGSQVDQFRIIRLLGRGGMSNVYMARDTHLGRRVALKVVRPSGQGQERRLERFLFEARTTAQFNHPHIVTVYAAGVHHGFPYLALEYLDGRTLRARMGQPLSLKESMRLILAIAEALEEAHAHGVLHRDLKPENVVIPRDGRLRVVDFGLATIIQNPVRPQAGDDDSDKQLTPRLSGLPPDVAGTPPYMAPEQWMGRSPTAATDIWALGVLLHELLTGHRPYAQAQTGMQLAIEVVGGKPVPIPDEIARLSAPAAMLVSRCLGKDPTTRPSAGEVVQDLRRLLGGNSIVRTGEHNPYQGLNAFREEHANLFFGRNDEVEAFLERLREQPVLAVVGPSGAGKSSFVQAGVIPRLREQGPWKVITLRPGPQPFRALASRIAAVDPEGERGALSVEPTLRLKEAMADSRRTTDPERPDLTWHLRDNPQLLALLLDRLAEHLRSRVLLFVDQLEELYTLVDNEEERRRFLEAVCSAADDPLAPGRVVLAVREDFLGRLAGGPAVRRTLDQVTVIRTPEPRHMEEILVRPLAARGFAFEDPDLVQEMIEAAGQEQASLPLLQFSARLLWERRDPERRLLTRAAYEAIGGVAGALASHADGVLEGLATADEHGVRDLLLRLVTPEGTRRMQALDRLLEGLPAGTEDLLSKLVKARLLTVRKARQGEGDGPMVELVHESLVRSWGRLARWIERSREDLAFLFEVEQQAQLWRRRGRRPDEVWQGVVLADALGALKRCQAPVPPGVSEFLAAGQHKEQARLWRRRLMLGFAALVLLVGMLVLLYQRDVAEARRQEARQGWAEALREGARAAIMRDDLLEARAKLRGSLETVDSPLARALWWQLRTMPLIWRRDLGTVVGDVEISPDGTLVAAAGQDRTVHLIDARTQADRTLRESEDQVLALAYSPDGELLATAAWSGQVMVQGARGGRARIVGEHRGAVWALAFSPDGKHLAAGGEDRQVTLWPLPPGTAPPRKSPPLPATVMSLVFTPDGGTLAMGLNDGTVHLCPPGQGPCRVLRGHRGGVVDIAVDRSGTHLASASTDRRVGLWDLGRLGLLRWDRGHSAKVTTVAFSPDGQLLASAGEDRTIRIVDVRSGNLRRLLTGHQANIVEVNFSRDGRRLVSGGWDRSVRLWDLDASTRQRVQHGHLGPVYGLSFSPSGTTLASAGSDHAILLWEASTGRQLATLTGHSDRVRSIAFSPDGEWLASGSQDRTVRLFQLASGQQRILGSHWAGVNEVCFSRDGKLLASAGKDWVVRLWDMQTGVQQAALKGHHGEVNGVAISPDGTLVASAGQDRTIRIFAVGSPAAPRALEGHQAQVKSVAFLPDGRRLASTGDDGTLRLWDLALGTSRILCSTDGRVYYLGVHPGGELLGVPRSDGAIALHNLSTGQDRLVRGHLGESNFLRFSPDGTRMASSSDDGTVRLWDVSTGLPRWHAPALLSSPPRLVSRRGWLDFDGRLHDAASARWAQNLGERAALARLSDEGRLLCLLDHDGRLELWDLASDRRLWQQSGRTRVQALAAGSNGCLSLEDGRAELTTLDGKRRVLLDSGATALGWHRGEVLLSAQRRVHVLVPEGDGFTSRILQGLPGVTALAHVGSWVVLGFKNGSLERVPDSIGQVAPSHSFEDLPSSPVLRLLPGPPGTVIAGFADGTVGLWHLRSGLRLDHAHLHGPVEHLLLRDQRLYAATLLGDRLMQDLGTFYEPRCRLLREVWRKVPVVWEQGQPRWQEPPRDHDCAP